MAATRQSHDKLHQAEPRHRSGLDPGHMLRLTRPAFHAVVMVRSMISAGMPGYKVTIAMASRDPAGAAPGTFGFSLAG